MDNFLHIYRFTYERDFVSVKRELWISKENTRMKIICCKEHAELAIDVIVDEFEAAPVVELLTGKGELSTTCEYCDEPGAYKVSNI